MTVHLMLNTLYVPSLPAVNSFHIAPVHDRVMLCTDLSKLIGGVQIRGNKAHLQRWEDRHHGGGGTLLPAAEGPIQPAGPGEIRPPG